MPRNSRSDHRSLGRAGGGRFAKVAFGDQVKTACLAYLPDLAVGDYTILHAGFALTRIDEESARITIATMREYGVFGNAEAAS